MARWVLKVRYGITFCRLSALITLDMGPYLGNYSVQEYGGRLISEPAGLSLSAPNHGIAPPGVPLATSYPLKVPTQKVHTM